MQVQVTGLDVLTISIVVIFVGRFLTPHSLGLCGARIGGDAGCNRQHECAHRPFRAFTQGLSRHPVDRRILRRYHQCPGDQVLSCAADDAARPALNQFTTSFDHKPNRTGNTGGRVAAAVAGAGRSSLGAALPRPLVISSLIPATSS